MAERRRYKRVELDVLVNHKIECKVPIANISEDGICIKTEKMFLCDNYLVLIVSLSEEKKIKAIGKVVWCKEICPETFEYGLKFWHITEEDRESLNDYMNKNNLVIQVV